ncbi:MAG: TlpA family protein disulfide reductase [Alphaproteobacteria bacterium]|nr:TlpA family protein disulfide reductase [Alphaproteobacteria bacterium]
MNTSIRLVLIVLAGAIVAAAAFAVYMLSGLNDEEEPLDKLGGIENFIPAREVKMAPSVQFLGKNGEKLNLENFRGRVVVLNLWATWCAPCVEEMPTLDHLQQQLAPLGVVVIALSLDSGGPSKVRAFFDENEIKNLGVFVDPTMEAQSGFNVIGLPTTILIDREGRERGRIVGPAAWDDAKAADLVLSASTPLK